MRMKNSLGITIGTFAIVIALVSACGPKTAPTPSGPTNNASAPNESPVPTQPATPAVVATATAGQISSPAPSAAPTSASLLGVFTKAHAALTSVKTVRLTLDSSVNGKTERYLFEYVQPNAYHETSPDGQEAIAIGGKGAYDKQGGKWSASSVTKEMLNLMIPTMDPIAKIDLVETQYLNGKDTPQIGADVLGGKPMVTYAYNFAAMPCKLWVGVTDGWLYKWTDSISAKGISETATVEYNLPISIVAPIP